MKLSRIAISCLLPLLALMLVVVHPAAKAAEAPAVGVMAPDFTLSSQEGKTVNLHDFRGKWVVLYFYPKDMTPGCTVEAHSFQSDLGKYQQINAVVLGVSVDSID